MLKKDIDLVLNNYLIESKKPYKNNTLASVIRNDLREDLYNILPKSNNLLVKCSAGQGAWSKVPWLGIFDKRITQSAMEGIYIVILFKENMSGFYLCLSQGVTFFNSNYGKIKKELNDRVVKWLRKKIAKLGPFNYDPVRLYDSYEPHLNYEDTNIISKYYENNDFNQLELKNDLKEIYQIYQELLNQRLIKNYHELINSFASEIMNENSKDIFSVDEDTAEMIEHMMREAGIDEGEVVLIETKPPTTYSKTGATEQRKKLKKIDFELKNKEDIRTGFIGEKLVVHKEKSDLIKRGKPELAKKVRWVSQDQDGLGFDVLSFNEDGSEKYIEVKTTTLSNVNQPFNISKNEILTSEKKNENFWIYRVYELKSDKPKFYKIQGPVEENFILEATSFLAYKK